MELTNKYIGNRIRDARTHREKTQKELAEYLGKTTGAVSQLELGNVQVSVVELAKIAQFLNKPIEYFYGEDYLGDDVQTIIAIFRRMDNKTRDKQAEGIRNMLKMQELADQIVLADENEDKELMRKLGLEFYQVLASTVENFNDFSTKGNQVQGLLAGVLEIDDLQNLLDQ